MLPGQNNAEEDIPFVAVYMITYNHASYISMAIEGILMQKTTFKYKLFIGDDFSTDNTRNICLSYKEKYPDRIKLFLNEKNIGPNNNARNIYAACHSSGAKYVAMCEGDDYWTDPFKLQKQVDFLEKNPQYSFCFHKVFGYEHDRNIGENPLLDDARTFGIEDLIIDWKVNTCSLVYKKAALTGPLLHMPDVAAADYAICLALALNGPYYYLPDNMAVYRRHAGSVTHTGMLSGLNLVNDTKKLFSAFNAATAFRYKRLVEKKILFTYLNVFTRSGASLNGWGRQKLKWIVLRGALKDVPRACAGNWRLIIGDLIMERSLK